MNLANNILAPLNRGIVASRSENEKNQRRQVRPKNVNLVFQKIVANYQSKFLVVAFLSNKRQWERSCRQFQFHKCCIFRRGTPK